MTSQRSADDHAPPPALKHLLDIRRYTAIDDGSGSDGMMIARDMALTAARWSGAAHLARKATARRLRILGYHGLWVTPGYCFGGYTFMTPALFEARMERLKRSRRPVLPLDEALRRLDEDSLPEAAVVITIDDGWASTLSHMLPILEHHGLPATLYATTWYAGRALPVINVAVDYLIAAAARHDLDRTAVIDGIEALPEADRLPALRAFGADLGIAEDWLATRQFEIMTPAELQEAASRGLDIQLHSHRHRSFTDRIDDLAHEVADNRVALQAALGQRRFDHFCFPGGFSHDRAAGILAGSDVRSATTTVAGLNDQRTDRYALRRFLDGQAIGMAQFDAYLSGVSHYLSYVREVIR